LEVQEGVRRNQDENTCPTAAEPMGLRREGRYCGTAEETVPTRRL